MLFLGFFKCKKYGSMPLKLFEVLHIDDLKELLAFHMYEELLGDRL